MDASPQRHGPQLTNARYSRPPAVRAGECMTVGLVLGAFCEWGCGARTELFSAGTVTLDAAVAEAAVPSLPPPTPCSDTQSDAHNCGRCGHGCCGGACVLGICQQAVLLTGGSGGSLAADGANLYSTDRVTGVVVKIPLGGGAPVTLATGECQAENVTVNATNVYWSAGCNPQPPGGIYRVSIDGGPTVLFASDPTALHDDVFLAGDDAYWTSYQLGTITLSPLDGGAPLVVASGQRGPFAIAASATDVYWSNSLDAKVMRASRTGGTPVMVASSQDNSYASALIVSSENLYAAEGSNVVAIPLDGGASGR
jgi:hypothetical protein